MQPKFVRTGMKAGRIYRRWAKEGARLNRRLALLIAACGQEGTPREIHDLRVVLRRLRFWSKVGKCCLNKKPRRRLDAWGKQVAALTGPVRDLDVAADWFRAHRGDEAVLAALREHREAVWSAGRAEWIDLPAGTLEALRPVVNSPEAARQLRRRVRRLEQRFEDHLVGRLDRFFKLEPEARHEVRRVVRRWRYLREILLARSERKEDPLLPALLEVQAALGDAQNLELAAHLLDVGSIPVPDALKRRWQQDLTGTRKEHRQRIKRALRGLRQALA